MPEDFDPGWEYRAGDPEILEITEPPPEGFDALGIDWFRCRVGDGRTGFRFGKASTNLNHDGTWVPRERVEPKRPPRKEYRRSCPTCKTSFSTDNRLQVYCSRRCGHFGRLKSPLPRVGSVAEHRAVIYWAREAGLTNEDIAEGFGVTETCVRTWVRKYGLPRRPPGNSLRWEVLGLSRRPDIPYRHVPYPLKTKKLQATVCGRVVPVTLGEYRRDGLVEIRIDPPWPGIVRGLLGQLSKTLSYSLRGGIRPRLLAGQLRQPAHSPPQGLTCGGTPLADILVGVKGWMAGELETRYGT